MTTVEARGCPNPMPGCREHSPAGDVGRAAGALLTGQRQDGPSCDPVREQYPRVAHGGAGSLTARRRAGLWDNEIAVAEDQKQQSPANAQTGKRPSDDV